MEDLSLAKLDVVYHTLEAATTVQEVKDTLDTLAAAKTYAEQKRVGEEIRIRVAEYIIEANCKLGEMLQAAKAAGQITYAHSPRHKPVIPDENNSKTTLKAAGIDPKLSSRAQKIASIPKEVLAKLIAEAKATGHATKLSPVAIIKASENSNKPESEKGIKPSEKTVHKAGLGASVEITIEMIASMSEREKLSRWREQERERLGRSFREAVFKEVDSKVESYLKNLTPKLQAEQDVAKRIMNARKGFMGAKVFKLIQSCLHADWVTDQKQKKRYDEAFVEFTKLKKFILDEKESPTDYADIPKTRAEWDAMRSKQKKAGKDDISL